MYRRVHHPWRGINTSILLIMADKAICLRASHLPPTKWAYIGKQWNILYHLYWKLKFPVKAFKTNWFRFVICSLKRKNRIRKHLPTALAILIRELRTLYGNEKNEGIWNNRGFDPRRKKKQLTRLLRWRQPYLKTVTREARSPLHMLQNNTVCFTSSSLDYIVQSNIYMSVKWKP